MHQIGQGRLDLLLGLRIDVGGGLVEQDQVRIPGKCPGDGQQLPFAAGDGAAAFGQNRIEASRKAFDQAAALGGLDDPLKFPVGHPALPQGDVLPDGGRKQKRVLGDQGEPFPVLRYGDLRQHPAVDPDPSPGRIVKACEQVHQGGFPRPGGSHDGQRLSGLQRQGDLRKDRLALHVGKPDPLQFDPAEAESAGGPIGGRGREPFFGVEQQKDPLGRRHGVLHHIVFFGDVPNRPEKHPHVGNKGDQCAEGDRLAQHPPAAGIDDQRHGGRPQHFDHRHEDRKDPDLLHTGLVISVVQDLEPGKIGGLLSEELDDGDAADGLGKLGVDFGQLDPQIPEHVPGHSRKAKGGESHQRQHREGDQGKPDVDAQQHRGDSHQQKQVLEHEHDNRGKQLVHVLHVVGDPGDEPAGGISAEKGNRQGLDVVEEGHAKIVQDPLAPVFEDHDLKKIQGEVGHDHRQQYRGCEGDAGKVRAANRFEFLPVQIRHRIEPDLGPISVPLKQVGMLPDHLCRLRAGKVDLVNACLPSAGFCDPVRHWRDDVPVDGDFGHIRQGQIEEGDEHNQCDGGGKHEAVGNRKRQQPSQQFQVVWLAQRLFLEVAVVEPHVKTPLRAAGACRCAHKTRRKPPVSHGNRPRRYCRLP